MTNIDLNRLRDDLIQLKLDAGDMRARLTQLIDRLLLIEPPKLGIHCPNHPTQPAASPTHSDLCAECLLKTPQPTS